MTEKKIRENNADRFDSMVSRKSSGVGGFMSEKLRESNNFGFRVWREQKIVSEKLRGQFNNFPSIGRCPKIDCTVQIVQNPRYDGKYRQQKPQLSERNRR